MAFGRENAATMALDDTLRRADYDTPLLAKSSRPRDMRMAEIMAWAASSHPYFSPKVDDAIELPDDLLEVDMPDVEVELSPGLRVTFSSYDFLPDGFSESDGEELSFPDDLIFFYRRGAIPRTDTFGGKESLLRILQKVPFVFVLQIDKNLPVPLEWISILKGIRKRLAQKFYFVCINEKMPSSGMLYIDGKLDSFFELTHAGNYISHGDLLRNMLMERINLSLVVPRDRADTNQQITLVMNADGDGGANGASVEASKPDLSSLPEFKDITIDGWLVSGNFEPHAK